MIIGTVREIKTEEYRVGLTPASVQAYTTRKHKVLVESGAGAPIGYKDADYRAAGATIVKKKADVFARAEMIVKVKEPLPSEIKLFRENQILFTYLHLAADEKLTKALMRKKVKAVAYETIEDRRGGLPCLKPMSEIAGRLSIQEGAKYLEKTFGGRGILLGGVPGVRRGRVAILGGGVVGINACKMAVGISADVEVLDLDQARMAYLDDVFSSQINTLHSTPANIERVIAEADVVVGAVLVPGAKAPKLVRKKHLSLMKPGAVLVDVAIDQGGCFETSKPTSHSDPIYQHAGLRRADLHHRIDLGDAALRPVPRRQGRGGVLPPFRELGQGSQRLRRRLHLRRGGEFTRTAIHSGGRRDWLKDPEKGRSEREKLATAVSDDYLHAHANF